MTTRLTIGSDAKGDCRISVEPAKSTKVEVRTKAESLVGQGVRAVTQAALQRFGGPSVELQVEDFGSLDYVLQARLETALRAIGLTCETPRRPRVPRSTIVLDAPRRSRLYAPGNNPRLLAGIEVHGADCVLLDLEDSVPPAEKEAARILVKYLLASVPFPREVWVRINPLDAGGDEDLREILQGSPHGICLPKAQYGDDVRRLAESLASLEAELDITPGGTAVMPILETAIGILHAEEIASSDARVVALAFGAEDYIRDIGALRSRRSLLFARSLLVAAAKAAGVQASDTVFSDLADEEGLAKECALARELGFDGKGAINPRQLDTIHRAFLPTPAEIEHAQRVVEAAAAAEADGSGAVALDGKMIDRPVLERAQRLIKYAKQLGLGGDAA